MTDLLLKTIISRSSVDNDIIAHIQKFSSYSLDNHMIDSILDVNEGSTLDQSIALGYNLEFNWMLNHSLFLLSYSFFEYHLKTIAEHYERINKSKIRIKDFAGSSSLNNYRKFLYLVCDIKAASTDNKDWSKLVQFRHIRNSIVHEQGLISEKNLGNIAKKHGASKWAKFEDKRLINLNDYSFVQHFNETKLNFLKAVISN